ncbi:hypothetical protein EDB19DRAFT_1965064 [Suillus lakei]|nr:hypothetical protein EDB19DRAFT_1965064 [Suillus lakei]
MLSARLVRKALTVALTRARKNLIAAGKFVLMTTPYWISRNRHVMTREIWALFALLPASCNLAVTQKRKYTFLEFCGLRLAFLDADLEDELVSLLGAMRSAFPIHIEPTLSSGSPVPVSTKCIFVNNPNNPGLTVVVSFLIDDDIEAIVQRCQEYAAELNSKYEDLNNFKPDVTVQQWEGEDFRPDLQGPIPVDNP